MMYFKREIEDKFKQWRTKQHCTLEVRGARQVGKTTTILHFARLNFKNIVYLNLASDDYTKFLEVLSNTEKDIDQYNGHDFEARMIAYGYQYQNTSDTVIIIDEIQLDESIYNKIRVLTRSLESRLIVTGSYLARALYDKKFFIPAGDIDIIEMTTLNFNEFIMATGESGFHNKMISDFQDEEFSGYKALFRLYMMFGGYPKVVDSLINGSADEARDNVNKILSAFMQESKNYTEFVDDAYLLDYVIEAISKFMFSEKKGMKSLLEGIRNRVNESENDIKVSTKTCKNLITWLYECGIIGFCGKYMITEGRSRLNYADTLSERIYFKDMGVLNHYTKDSSIERSTWLGKQSENYMYIVLSKKLKDSSVVNTQPMFAVLKEYEFDFLIIRDGKKYLFEIKHGNSSSASFKIAREKNVADYYYYFGDVSRVTINHNSVTAPLYLAETFQFDERSRDKEEEELLNALRKMHLI